MKNENTTDAICVCGHDQRDHGFYIQNWDSSQCTLCDCPYYRKVLNPAKSRTFTSAGMKSKQVTISDDCRTNRGGEPAFDEAVRQVREIYLRASEAQPIGEGTSFHLILAIEKEQKTYDK